MPLDQEFLALLACPGCLKPLKLVTEKADGQDIEKLKCENHECGLTYPIRSGIPVLLVSEAEGSQTIKDKYKGPR